LSTSASTAWTTDAPDDAEGAPQILTFQVHGRLYGTPMSVVREIVGERPATRLPGAPPYVRGLVNLRGTLLTVVDLAVRLEVRTEPADAGHVLVVELEGRLGGCAVDAVKGVHPFRDVAGNAGGGGVVMGFGEVNGEHIPLLDLPSIIRQALLFPGER
jgi:purine-binding chemotaxis protein CheW